MTAIGRLPALLAVTILAAALAGCAAVGSTTMPRDRMDYARAAARAEREQLLRSMIDLRYAEVPTFLEMQQVVSGYEVSTSVNANVLPDLLSGSSVGGAAQYTDRPTITYGLMTGAEFYREQIVPIPPAAVFFLLGAGWRADGVMWTGVRAINGVVSQAGMGGAGADASTEFAELIRLFMALQDAEAIDLRLRAPDGDSDLEKPSTVLWLENETATPETEAILGKIKTLLKLDPEAEQFELVYGRLGQRPDRLLVQTRSLLEMLILGGRYAIAPEAHIAEGRTVPNVSEELRANSPAFRILSARSRPDDAFVAIKAHDVWFYIDDKDFETKRTFGIIQLMQKLAEQDSGAAPPVVTITAN